MIKKYSLFFSASLLSLLFVTFVFAAGGGGGGSVPSCTESVYQCTEWSSCSTSGTQTRVCQLTYFCPSASNSKPDEIRSCTPPQPPPPAPTPPPTSNEGQTLTPTPPPAPQCTNSKYECGNWSDACDANGLEHRTCRLVSECTQNPTPPPISARACSHLQCGNKPTIEERILCRVSLNPAGVARELEIQYLPEACRAETDAIEKKECIERYKSYQQCWALPVGKARFDCANTVLKISTVPIQDQVKDCKLSKDQSACMNQLREKVFYMVQFRFYDLEQRAEDLFYKGVSNETIADFDIIVETKKQAFNSATTDAERRQIILDVRKAWQDFVNKAKDQIK